MPKKDPLQSTTCASRFSAQVIRELLNKSDDLEIYTSRLQSHSPFYTVEITAAARRFNTFPYLVSLDGFPLSHKTPRLNTREGFY